MPTEGEERGLPEWVQDAGQSLVPVHTSKHGIDLTRGKMQRDGGESPGAKAPWPERLAKTLAGARREEPGQGQWGLGLLGGPGALGKAPRLGTGLRTLAGSSVTGPERRGSL